MNHPVLLRSSRASERSQGDRTRRNTRRPGAPLFVIVAVALGPADGAVASCDPEELQILEPSDGAEGNGFGKAVDLCEVAAIVGAQHDDESGNDAGAAYVYERPPKGPWVAVVKLLASDGEEADVFGVSVTVEAGVALVGAPLDDDNGGQSGSVYVFEREPEGTWPEISKLTASDGAIGDQFGISVDVDETLAVIGAHYDDDNGGASGSAYVFERQAEGDWLEIDKLIASDGEVDDWFGRGVAISGGTIVVGAPIFGGGRPGSAYVFERQPDQSWQETAKLTAADGRTGDLFGYGVAITGETVVVGAMEHYARGTNSGAAYVFRRQGDGSWPQVAKLTASDGAAGDAFGWRVSAAGEALLIGAPGHDDGDAEVGAAYLFQRRGDGAWVETAKLKSSDAEFNDRFGSSVALHGNAALAGAPGPLGRHPTAYVFDLSACMCPADLDGDGVVGFQDVIAVLVAWGNEGGPEDLDGSGVVDFGDIVVVLSAWGPCE